jgi:hypothetical protein
VITEILEKIADSRGNGGRVLDKKYPYLVECTAHTVPSSCVTIADPGAGMK